MQLANLGVRYEPLKPRQYLLPALLAAAILAAVLVAGSWWLRRAEHVPKHASGWPDPESVSLPGGRVLYVVVDTDGYYVGEDFVPFFQLDSFLKRRASQLDPNYGIVCGTQSSRYGHVVEALDAVRANFRIYATIRSEAIPNGMRRGAIEQHRNWWDYY